MYSTRTLQSIDLYYCIAKPVLYRISHVTADTM